MHMVNPDLIVFLNRYWGGR